MRAAGNLGAETEVALKATVPVKSCSGARTASTTVHVGLKGLSQKVHRQYHNMQQKRDPCNFLPLPSNNPSPKTARIWYMCMLRQQSCAGQGVAETPRHPQVPTHSNHLRARLPRKPTPLPTAHHTPPNAASRTRLPPPPFTSHVPPTFLSSPPLLSQHCASPAKNKFS